MSDPLISVRGLCKSYGATEVLRNVDLDVNRGDVISVIGPSGCGKSTLIRCLNFLDPPTSGEIWFAGERVTQDPKSLAALRRRMGMVFQSFNLFGNMTVVENATVGPVNLLGRSRQEAYDRAMDLLDTVGLAHKALSYPDELSGGQRQRAAIARTLAMGPEAIIFDEPTSALDPTMVGEVLGVMKDLADKGTTMLIVTHEMHFARNASNRVLYMDDKGIYEDGSPEQIFEHPLREKTHDFIFHVRDFTYDIYPGNFDFYEFVGQVALFMRRQLFVESRIQKVLYLLDRAVNRCVLVANDDLTRFCLRYTEKTDELEIIFTDPEGVTVYPYEGADERSRKIIERYGEVEREPGRLTIRMRKREEEAR
jgi:polar amino acid transport system ATP-binding protein